MKENFVFCLPPQIYFGEGEGKKNWRVSKKVGEKSTSCYREKIDARNRGYWTRFSSLLRKLECNVLSLIR